MLMNLWNARVEASPSTTTQAGRDILAKFPDSPGSLGIAISEAMELAIHDPGTKYSLGSVLNHVLLHQTIIGLEAEKQFEKVGDYPDMVIGCLGGGSNFAGISFPFVRHNLDGKRKTRFIAVEPSSCPKLTKGMFRYDFGDVAGTTPLLPMHTLGHDFIPPGIHAGGLRYHGAAPLVSTLVNEGIVEAVAIDQLECFEAGLKFAQAEGILPAPETSHAIAYTIREALKAKAENTPKTILFNLSGHGYFDMYAYQQYLDNKLTNFAFDDVILGNIEGQTHPIELASK
jgi:tryptophan synthase beta chain